MKRAFLMTWAVVLMTLGAAGCRSAGPVETQRAFGTRMAKENLWREAMFRFRRAVELDPTSAEARSNLAVALEANGDLEGAAREYREAMKLDKSNEYIQKNYSRFVEFTTRNRKREMREPRHQEADPKKDGQTEATPAAGESQKEPPVAAPAGTPGSEPSKPVAPATEAKPAAAAPAAPPPPPPPDTNGSRSGGMR